MLYPKWYVEVVDVVFVKVDTVVTEVLVVDCVTVVDVVVVLDVEVVGIGVVVYPWTQNSGLQSPSGFHSLHRKRSPMPGKQCALGSQPLQLKLAPPRCPDLQYVGPSPHRY